MDKSQLVTIAVTAIITAFAKEIATWLSSIVKNLSTNSTIKAKIKNALTANKIEGAANLGFFIYFSFKVYKFVTLPDPIDRVSAFAIVINTCLAFLCFTRIEVALKIWNDKRLQAAKQESELAEWQAILDEVKRVRESAQRTLEGSEARPEPPGESPSDRPK